MDSTIVESSYNGIIFPEDGVIDHDWIIKVMEDMKENKFIHKKYLIHIISQVKEIYDMKSTLVDVEIPDEDEFNVCGDIHGQYYDLLNIFKINGYPSKTNPYLFNGDFVDRGSFSVECIITLLCWKVLYPDHFHMTRGNHETRNLNKLYGFEGEVKAKYDESVYECFCELFCSLPLGHVLNKTVIVVHGGLFSQDGVTLQDIKNTIRFREPPEKGIMSEILWSDPTKLPGRHPSKRGVGVSFGPDVAKRFLDDNKLSILVRSHEVKNEGYEEEADGRVITIFSAPNYCDQMGNKGALIRFRGDEMKPKYVQYTAVVINFP
jgi:serine/threonine-protein phosphatase 5